MDKNPRPFQVSRLGRIDKIEAKVIAPIAQLQIKTKETIGLAIHETNQGPALAITLLARDGQTLTGLVTPEILGTFMATLTEKTRRLGDALIPAEGETKQ